MSWLPRIGIVPATTPGLDLDQDPYGTDFDGRALIFQWRRFVVELFLGRRA